MFHTHYVKLLSWASELASGTRLNHTTVVKTIYYDHQIDVAVTVYYFNST